MSMAEFVFVDTWAWLALSNRKDVHHELAKKSYEEIKTVGYRLVTSDYVLDEVITALFRNVAFASAVQFIESLFTATDFTSFVLMQELAINNVFTGDSHFERVNLGFEIIPK
jgi:predicted nucleic acid-binding protein